MLLQFYSIDLHDNGNRRYFLLSIKWTGVSEREGIPEFTKLSLSEIKSGLGLLANLSDAGDGDGHPVSGVHIHRGHADGHRVQTQSMRMRI